MLCLWGKKNDKRREEDAAGTSPGSWFGEVSDSPSVLRRPIGLLLSWRLPDRTAEIYAGGNHPSQIIQSLKGMEKEREMVNIIFKKIY